MKLFFQTLYDEAFVSLYNVCYTSLPVLALGIFDQVSVVAGKALKPAIVVMVS